MKEMDSSVKVLSAFLKWGLLGLESERVTAFVCSHAHTSIHTQVLSHLGKIARTLMHLHCQTNTDTAASRKRAYIAHLLSLIHLQT